VGLDTWGGWVYISTAGDSKMEIPDYMKRLQRLGLKVTVEAMPQAA